MQDLCSELQEDNAHLKKALVEREQGARLSLMSVGDHPRHRPDPESKH